MTRSRTWTLGTVVVVLAIFALGWFAVISPKKSNAASLNGLLPSSPGFARKRPKASADVCLKRGALVIRLPKVGSTDR